MKGVGIRHFNFFRTENPTIQHLHCHDDVTFTLPLLLNRRPPTPTEPPLTLTPQSIPSFSSLIPISPKYQSRSTLLYLTFLHFPSPFPTKNKPCPNAPQKTTTTTMALSKTRPLRNRNRAPVRNRDSPATTKPMHHQQAEEEEEEESSLVEDTEVKMGNTGRSVRQSVY